MVEKKVKPKEKFRKQFYRGLSEEDLSTISTKDFIPYMNSTTRRRFKRGLSPEFKKLIRKVIKYKRRAKENDQTPKLIKTHLRDAIVLPCMLGMTFGIYNGREYIPFEADIPKLGCAFGWFGPTRKPVNHGKGAVQGSSEVHYIPYK